ncbi:MAG: hypothetical protein WB814_17175, partial [Candidatus Sulfotelmatobacter sp.]
FDPRVLAWESSAVAQAAMDTGVAQEPVDIRSYREQLERQSERMGERELEQSLRTTEVELSIARGDYSRI